MMKLSFNRGKYYIYHGNFSHELHTEKNQVNPYYRTLVWDIPRIMLCGLTQAENPDSMTMDTLFKETD